MRKIRKNHKAFSLVEVALALGIAAFCLITLTALIPTGITDNKDSIRRTTAASIATAMVSDLQSATTNASGAFYSPIYGISIPTTGGTVSTAAPAQILYSDIDGGTNTSPTAAGIVYRISVGFNPPAGSSRAATAARILVTWPAASGGTATGWPTNYAGSLETATAINCN